VGVVQWKKAVYPYEQTLKNIGGKGESGYRKKNENLISKKGTEEVFMAKKG